MFAKDVKGNTSGNIFAADLSECLVDEGLEFAENSFEPFCDWLLPHLFQNKAKGNSPQGDNSRSPSIVEEKRSRKGKVQTKTLDEALKGLFQERIRPFCNGL